MSGANESADDGSPDETPEINPDQQREVVERIIARHHPDESDPAELIAAAIGLCYTLPGISEAIGMTVAEVTAAAARLDLLALTTSDGVVLYPAFQVVDGAVVTGLGEVLRTLQTGFDSSLMWTLWLLGNPPLTGETCRRPSYMEQLTAGDVDGVVRAALHTAWAWRA